MTNKEDKEVGGIYAIEDDALKWAMLELADGGVPCNTIDEFIEMVFDFHQNDRFIVCPMPGQFELDLKNDIGAASTVDAMQAYVNLFADGYSIFVWDQKSKIALRAEQNEYVYQPLKKLIENRARHHIRSIVGPAVHGTKMPCPEAASEKDHAHEQRVAPIDLLRDGDADLLKQVTDALMEYASYLEDHAYEDNPYDERALKDRAAWARSLSGRCSARLEWFCKKSSDKLG